MSQCHKHALEYVRNKPLRLTCAGGWLSLCVTALGSLCNTPHQSLSVVSAKLCPVLSWRRTDCEPKYTTKWWQLISEYLLFQPLTWILESKSPGRVFLFLLFLDLVRFKCKIQNSKLVKAFSKNEISCWSSLGWLLCSMALWQCWQKQQIHYPPACSQQEYTLLLQPVGKVETVY